MLELLAQTFERLGRGAENGTWRNFYLMGATELRNGIGPAPIPDIGAGMAAALTVEQLFDSVAIRVNGPKAWSEHLTIDWHFTDLDQRYRMSLSNGVLVHYQNPGPGAADLAFTLTKAQLLGMLAGGGLEGVEHQGDPRGAPAAAERARDPRCHLRDRDPIAPGRRRIRVAPWRPIRAER
jgi:alkyl sulfatase BDS1-like metallo-beta-lactamase superfamily hydrolase